VRELREGGTTVVLTTHYLEEAEELADRLAIMRAGRIVVSGTPAEVTASRPSRIRFTLPEGVPAARLPLSLKAAWVSPCRRPEDERRVEIRTERLQEALTELLLWARREDVSLEGLDARSASLEEAFLEIAHSGGGTAEDGTANDGTARLAEAGAR
jgi:ABC-2 type transport system ATP-binding protein